MWGISRGWSAISGREQDENGTIMNDDGGPSPAFEQVPRLIASNAGAAIVPSALLLAKPLSEIAGLEHIATQSGKRKRKGYSRALTGEDGHASMGLV